MSFWKVATAIIMFKLLDAAWGYAFIIGGERETVWKGVAIMTIAWLVLCAGIWGTLQLLADAIKRHNRNG